MLEYLHSIRGSDFLIIYPLWCLVCFLVYRLLLGIFNEKRNIEYIDVANYKSYQVLLLSYYKKTKAFIYAVIIDMLNEKSLLNNADGTVQANPSKRPDDKIKQAVWEAAIQPLRLPQITSNYSLVDKIKELVAEDEKFLKDEKMIISDETHRIRKMIFLFMLLVFYFPGIAKLIMGIYYHKPVSFLVLELIALSIILFLIAPVQKISPVGKKALKLLRKHYSKDFSNIRKNQQSFPDGVDPLLAAGLFGLPMLFMFPEFSGFSSLSNVGLNSSYYSSTGYSYHSTGCSSCTSSHHSDSSGSGCSSCSGGGSGCGGCGGGD